MSIRDSLRLKSAIELVREEARSGRLSQTDGERYAQLATIWVSGYLEASCREMLLEYSRKRADPAVFRFVSWNLERLPSPKVENIAAVIGRFDQEAAKTVRSYSKGEIRDSVDGIVESRHAVAHGRAAEIMLDSVFRHYDNVAKLIKKMERLLA